MALCAGAAIALATRTDLDSHCNVPLVGADGCNPFEDTGRRMDIRGYKGGEATDIGVPIMNVICAHDCPFSKKTITGILQDVQPAGLLGIGDVLAIGKMGVG